MLPRLYGGLCECEASCVFSDKGPWTEVENKVNYMQRKGLTGGDVIMPDEVDHKKGKEEYKFEDDDDDEVDLLGEASKLADLKSALQ